MTVKATATLLIARPVESVHECIVNPREMESYFITRGSARLEEGKTLTWTFAEPGSEDGGRRAELRILKADTDLISFLWKAGGTETLVILALSAARRGETRVTITESPWENTEKGHARALEQTQFWVEMLCCLKAWMEQGMQLRSGAARPRQRRKPAVLRPEGSAWPFELETERVMAVPTETLYSAWTEKVDQWFAAPGTVIMRAEEGAPFFFETRFEDRRHPHYGRFISLDPGRLVEMTWLTEGTLGTETVVRVMMTPVPEGTRLRLTHTGFSSQESRDRHEQAWPLVLRQLEERMRSG